MENKIPTRYAYNLLYNHMFFCSLFIHYPSQPNILPTSNSTFYTHSWKTDL